MTFLLPNLSLHIADEVQVIQVKHSFILLWVLEFAIPNVFAVAGEKPFW